MGLKENLDLAEQAVKYVKSTIRKGACNKISARLAAAGGIDAVIARDKLAEEQALDRAMARPIAVGAGAPLADKKRFFEEAQRAASMEKGDLLPKVGPYQPPKVETALEQARAAANIAAGGRQAVVVGPLLAEGASSALAKGGLRPQDVAFLRQIRAKYLALGPSSLLDITAIADVAVAHGVGNCGEQSIVAYRWLNDKNARPIDLMGFTELFGLGYDHMWVVIGRQKDSKPTEMRTWGDEAVWCDPWQGDNGLFYSIDDFIKGAVRNLDARYKLNSIELVEAGTPMSLRRDE